MPHAYVTNLAHCVWSTKGRSRSIPERRQEELWAYIAGIGKRLGMPVLAVGGMPDHLHVLFSLPPTVPLATAVQKIKANSSRWMRQHSADFRWQEGYCAMAVSESMAKTVKAYIRNQSAHHRKRTFEQEFVALLKKSGIAFDPNRVFD